MTARLQALRPRLHSWGGKPFTGTISPIASALLNAKLADGQYLIPSAQTTAPYEYGVPNVTLIGTSTLAVRPGERRAGLRLEQDRQA